MIQKIICYFFGHKYITRATIDNGFSQYGDMICQRCSKVHNWQYDYIVE